VTREVGTEGKLESRAVVKGAAGVWKNLTDNVNEMIRSLRETTQKSSEQDWLKTNLAKFTQMLQGQRDLMTVAKLILSELAPVISAQHGVFYVMETEDGASVLKLLSAYAYKERKGPSNRFALGEGLVGQCALEKERILITDVPDDYIRISSGLGAARPLNIVVLPVLFEGQVKAVIELASFNRFKDVHLNLLDQLTETIGIVLNTIEANMRTETLLRQSQSLAQELQSQQEELQESNARLKGQARELQTSEELLKNRQEELKGANEELRSKAQQLAQQKAEVEAKKSEIELANLTLEERAEQLAVASKYKSEFLANMSHELRTPLNSLLILAEMLASEQQGHMTPKQIEFAKTIYSAGSDLLILIDDILDMAKIESGTMVVEVSEAPFTELRELVERTFRPVAETKGLHFTIELADNLPQAISTDAKRLQQVLRNLLSNAFKFTEDGKVSLNIDVATKGWSAGHPVLSRAETVIAFAVSDTGVGIPPEKLNIIFEPFQQAEMGAARKYGGTGLGLSISREIARLLGGEIRVQSTVEEGSTFTLFLPQTYGPLPGRTGEMLSRPVKVETVSQGGVLWTPRREFSSPASLRRNEIGGDYGALESGDRVVLIVERDPKFAAILLDIAHDKGFKAVIASTGETGLALALQLLPNAITLDLRLPDLHGWIVLDRLKHDLTTRHIPVHVISSDSNYDKGRKMGAFACLRKPVTREALDNAFARIKSFVTRRVRNLLVVENNEVERVSIVKMVANGDVQVTAVTTAGEALTAIQTRPYDCLVLDLRLPDMPGFELLEKIKKNLDLLDLPVIVYTGKELSEAEEARLNELAEAIIPKAPGSLERVREKVALFLHRIGTERPTSSEQAPSEAPGPDQELAHKKVLAVDDDVRSLFAIVSILERWQMQVLQAESGREALASLDEMPDIDLVLMDIMMPYLDGYETIRRIRQQERFQYLPIIALTAKALKGDREKCLAAGASDYLAKPFKVEQLQALLRVWLGRSEPVE
jgi:signal transduction histidine kinase/DNA-binding response OmpR family regulator